MTSENSLWGESESGLADALTQSSPVLATLREWSAEDFARVYSRFRTPLVLHARRFLRDPSLAEEIVQDAFLYLMTALPELDSEPGVLRYLRWKVRNLAIDAGRRKALNTLSLESDQEFFSGQLGMEGAFQPSQDIEASEDAAIVRLAFSRLSTNQRLALVHDVVEEKSNSQAAADMQLEPGAFRQLLYRSRKAFRRELERILQDRGITVEEFRKGRKYLTSVPIVALVASGIILLSQFTAGSGAVSTVAIVEPALVERNFALEQKSSNLNDESPSNDQIFNVSENLSDQSLSNVEETSTASVATLAPIQPAAALSPQSQPEVQNFALDLSPVRESASQVAGEILSAHFQSKTGNFAPVQPEGKALSTEEGFTLYLPIADGISVVTAISWSNQSDPKVASVLIEQLDNEGKLVGLATGLHSQARVEDGLMVGRAVATGFAASDLTPDELTPVLEDGHLFELGLDISWVLDTSDGNLILGQLSPIFRN